MKERIDFECEVIGVATGKKGSKYEDMVAKLIVAFRAFGRNDGELIVLPVGSGLTDDERRAFTEDPCRVLGRIAKIKAKSYTEYGNLREPVIEEWREDKDEGDFPFNYGGEVEKTIAGSHWTYTDIKE